jgi:Tol biopolymer transport system component
MAASGHRLVFTTFRAGNGDVRLLEAGVAEERALTSSPEDEGSPIISSDGSSVAYVRYTRDSRAIRVRHLDSLPKEDTEVCDNCFLAWDWSPDNKNLLYWSADQNKIGVLDVSSREKAVILEHPGYAILRSRLSPDGRWIAFAAIGGRYPAKLFVAPFHGTEAISEEKWIAVIAGNVPRWAPDGNSLYFVSRKDGFSCLWRQGLDPNTKRPLGQAESVYHAHGARRSISAVPISWFDISVAPDRIVFPMSERTANIWMAEWNR